VILALSNQQENEDVKGVLIIYLFEGFSCNKAQGPRKRESAFLKGKKKVDGDTIGNGWRAKETGGGEKKKKKKNVPGGPARRGGNKGGWYPNLATNTSAAKGGTHRRVK